jgi:predicted transcriptional regulator
LQIRREILKNLLKEKGWCKTEFAKMLGINYSYFHRLLKGERNPGSKFFSSFLKFCKEENLEFEDYVYIKTNKD